MKRKHNRSRTWKQLFLAVPASALMLGSSQAQTTVGLNIQGYYYNSNTSPQTVGYGAGYQTTGFPVTATAFGVAPENWFTTDALGDTSISTNMMFAGTLTALLTANDVWESGIGEQVAGWNPETVPPGNDEVTWAYLDDAGGPPSVALSGLHSVFPHGYVIQTIAAEANTTLFDGVVFTDGITNDAENYTTYFVPSAASDGADNGGTVGLALSQMFTNDTININCQPRTTGSRSTLAGFIITDIPVVSQSPVGVTNDLGNSFTLTAGAFGVPPLSYQWQLNGTNVPGATSMIYSNTGTSLAAAGDYDVVVSNSYGATPSEVATVALLQAPTILVDLPKAATNYSTMNANFAFVAGGSEPLTFTWTKNGQAVSLATESLVLTNLQSSDAGSYQVVVQNAFGSATSSVVSLTVLSSLPPYEGFQYSTGDLAGQSGGIGWSGAWTQESGYNGDATVFSPATPWRGGISQLDSSGSAALLAGQGSADYEDIRSLMTSLGGAGSGTVYLSFAAQITNTTWGGIELVQDGVTTLFLGSCWEGADWGWGGRAAPDAASTVSPFTYSLLVYRFDYTPSNTLVRLYVNPESLAAEPSTATVSGAELKQVTFDQIRIVSHGFLGSGVGPDGIMDDIRVGGSWAAVTPHTLRNDQPFSLAIAPGGVIQDTKPAGTLHPGLSFNTTWLGSNTDNNSVTRTGVEQFSAANQGQITLAPNADFASTNGTISFWMLYGVPLGGFPGKGSEAAMLFDRRLTNGTIIGLSTSGGIEFQALGGAGGVNHFVGASYVVDGNWHEVTITYDQSTNGLVSLYVDGALDTAQANTAAWSWPAAQEIELGRSHDPYWYIYDGQMDDFRMYNTILTSSEVAAIGAPATSSQLEEPSALEVLFEFDTGNYGDSLIWPFGQLQSSPSLGATAVWTTLTNGSPLPFLPTNPATFYRLFGTP